MSFVLCVAILSFLTYRNSLSNPFLLDDHSFFSDPRIQNIRYAPLHFIPQKYLLHSALSPSDARNYYRPLAHVVPMAAYRLFGENAFGHHILNWILLVTASLFIYALFNRLQNNPAVSMLASLLFCLHPVNGLLVNYVTANVIIVQMIAMTLSILSVLSSFDHPRRSLYVALGMLSFVVSLLCHETAIMLPVYLAIALWGCAKTDLRTAFKAVVPFIVIAVLYFMFRLETSNFLEKLAVPASSVKLSFGQYVATLAQLLTAYLSGLIYLKDIVLMWVMPAVREDIFIWNFGFWGVVALVLVFVLRAKKQNVKTLAGLWFVTGFIPVTVGCLVNLPGGLTLEPHWLLFSSFGFFLFVAALLLEWQAVAGRSLTFVVILAVILAEFFVSRGNNRIWSDELQYCQYWYRVSPNPKSAIFLAAALQRSGDDTRAEEYYKKSFQGDFDDWKIFHNLGLIAQKRKNAATAMEYYHRALQIHPASAISYNNLGLVQLESGQAGLAEQSFLTSIQMDPLLFEHRLNLASLYTKAGNFPKVFELYRANLQMNPDDEKTLSDLTTVYFRLQKPDEAVKLSSRLFKNITLTERMVNFGSLFAASGHSKIALRFYEKALRTDPHSVNAFIEFGKWHANRQDFSSAIQMWQKALAISPDNAAAQELIDKARHAEKTKLEK